MAVYIIALTFLFFAGIIVHNKYLGIVAILFLLFLSMFRDATVGFDTEVYINPGYYITHFRDADGIRAIERINLWVSYLIPYLGNYVVLRFYSLTTFIFFILACKRFNTNITYFFFFFVLFVFFNLSLNIARQITSASILLFAYSFLIEEGKKKNWFFPLVVLAAGIHSSAIIFIFVYFIRKIDLTKVKTPTMIIIIVSAFILVRTLAQPFIDWANTYSLSTDEDLVSYATYFEQAEKINRSATGIVSLFLTTILNTLVLLGLIKLKDEKSRIIALMFFVGMIVSMFFENIYGNLGRLRYDLELINPMAYSYYFLNVKSSNKKVLLVVSIAVFGSLYIFTMNSASAYGSVPYFFRF